MRGSRGQNRETRKRVSMVMGFTLSRRQVLFSAPLFFALAGPAKGAGGGLDLGPPQPFDFDRLSAEAQSLAARPYVPPKVAAPDILEQIDFEQQIEIQYRPDRTILPGTATPIRLFHPHKYAEGGVRISLV